MNNCSLTRFLFILLIALSVLPVGLSAHRPKVGLVLGGGGAKGAAEIGVLKWIEKAQTPIDCIAGTSIGALVGGLYSVGYTSSELDSIFRCQQWYDVFAGGALRGKGVGLLSGDSVVSLMDSLISRKLGTANTDLDFDSLPIPFRCVAVDMRSMREVVLRRGSLSRAICSSMSIPLLFKPMKWDTLALVDGGVLNNLPVDVAREKGANVVIAVDLTQSKPENFIPERIRKIGDDLPLSGIVEWLIRRPDQKKYTENCRDADLYIHPRLPEYGVADFDVEKIDDMIARGEKAGRKAYSKLKRIRRNLAK